MSLNKSNFFGFLPNVHDTRIAARYVDENGPSGLKKCSRLYLNYDQTEYKDVMRFRVKPENKPFAGGRQVGYEEIYPLKTRPYKGKKPELLGTMVSEEDRTQPPEVWVTIEYRMDEVPAQHVLAYGADDTICTLALHHFYRLRMEIENTYHVYHQVEQLPQYLTSLGFLQGVPFSLEKLRALEKEDREEYVKAEAVLRDFLMQSGWQGSVAPVFEDLSPATIKQVFQLLTGQEFDCRARLPAKVVQALEEQGQDLLAQFVKNDNLAAVNQMVARNFKPNPVLDTGSTKEMRQFLYKTLGLPVRLVNKCTDLEREHNRPLVLAVQKHSAIWAGRWKEDPTMSQAELDLLYTKARTDEFAVNFCYLDAEGRPEIQTVLDALRTMKKVQTRQSLYYTPYPLLRHWLDGKLHSALNQSSTITLRHTSAGPNLQQMPKKGEGVKVRGIITPHKRRAVVVSIDFSGQELRIGAHRSGDLNMIACFVGDSLKDMHSLTAAGAMRKKWGLAKVVELSGVYGEGLDADSPDFAYDLFMRLRRAPDEAVKKLADDLRKVAKNVNFAAGYDATAPKLAEQLTIPVADAQTFLDAKYAMFPQFEVWKEDVRRRVKKRGYATTLLGARRHLREQILSDDKWIAEKAGRQGPNFEIQSSSAEQTKLALASMWRCGLFFRYDAQFIAPIHDEVVSSVSYERSDDDVVNFIREKHACMVQPYADMSVPILGSISIGPNFAKQYEVGDTFDEAAIRAALQKIKQEQGFDLPGAA